MVVRQTLMVVGLAAAMIAACGGGAETSGGDGGDGGFITGAGGGPQTGTGVPTTTGTGTGVPTTTTGTGGTGGTMTGGTGGTGGTGTGSTCTDIGLGEPNESEATAWPLKMGSIEDCDGDGDSITGTLAPGDVDWFFYEGDDTSFCIVNPERTLSQSQSGLRLCKFFECLNGQTEVNCPSGTTAETSPEQRPGCCDTGGFEVSDLNCTGTADEHVYVYIRLDQPGGGSQTCNDYALSYHY